MGLFGGDSNKKLSDVTVKTPKELFSDVLKITSGTGVTREIKYDIFYQIIAFRGITHGLGVSTIVANTALAIAETGLTVCVIDTSIECPVQDVLLNTTVWDVEDKQRLDWFDMPYSKKSCLHVSKLNKNVSVLSFAGKKRGVVDMMSTADAVELVELAFEELHTKFDLILVDSCHELTSVSVAALQQSQRIVQVWSDAPQVTRNIDTYITNCMTLSVPLDKMRYVIYNKVTPDLIGADSDELLKAYHLVKLASMRNADIIQRTTAMGKALWQTEGTDPALREFTDMIITIACHLLNVVPKEKQHKGSFTANDIDEGNVKGTLKYKNKQKAKDMPPVITTLEDADASIGLGVSEGSDK